MCFRITYAMYVMYYIRNAISRVFMNNVFSFVCKFPTIYVNLFFLYLVYIVRQLWLVIFVNLNVYPYF